MGAAGIGGAIARPILGGAMVKRTRVGAELLTGGGPKSGIPIALDAASNVDDIKGRSWPCTWEGAGGAMSRGA